MQPDKSYASPNGRYRLEIHRHEINMSQWVDCPYLYDLLIGEYIFSAGQLWHTTEVKWQNDGNELDIDLSHYGDSLFPITVSLDLENDRASIAVVGYNTISSGNLNSVGGELSRTTEFRLLFY